MLLLVLVQSPGQIASLIERGMVDSVLSILKDSPSPADFMIAYSLIMRSSYTDYVPRLIELGKKKFGKRFMNREAFQYYLDRGDVDKALRELNYMYGLQSVKERFLMLEEKFGDRVWKSLRKLKNPSPTLRRVVASILIERGRYGEALPFARTFDDTLRLARFLMDREQYEMVVSLLKDNYRRRKEAAKLYGLALYHLGKYSEAAPVLERIEPQMASEAYYRAGNLEKAELLSGDTATLIRTAFARGQYGKALQLCEKVFIEECVAAALLSHPDSAMEIIARLSMKASRVSPATGILVQVASTYPQETVRKFMENVFMGKNHRIEDDLYHLSLALRGEIQGMEGKAIEHYRKVNGWAKPFALYRLYVLTGKEEYRRQLLNDYPQSAYAIMVARE